jgi:hypothetical protein
MSEHKTGRSNWTAEQKREYRDRRNNGERGTETLVLEKPVDYRKETNGETGEPKYLPHFGPNRRARRQKVVDRSATKKGMTRIVHINENQQARRLFVQKGSKPYNLAMTAGRRIQKAAARGE